MKLKVLGSGTIVPGRDIKNCSGYFLDHKLLFDCGPGIWRALHENKIAIIQINHILLSHFHIDHVSDLLAILLSRWMLKSFIKQPLILCGPEGIKDWFEKLSMLASDWIKELDIKIIENSQNEMHLLDYKISCLPTPHTYHSVCYRVVDQQGRVFFYSGDSDFDHNLIKLAKDSDLALLECSCLQEIKARGHLTPQLAGRVARLAAVKCLALTHQYPETLQQDIIALAKEEYDGKIILIKDGIELEF
jgi:ribonuclease BN (tRNA processing enzyme)